MSVSRNRIRFLENALLLYRALLSQIDQLCDHIVESSPDAIVCRAGCSGCCQLEGALPVEAAHLFIAWHALPSHRKEQLRGYLSLPERQDGCPLLADGLCLLYEARPIICRTHGLPLLIDDAAGTRVDHCRLNFLGHGALPGEAIIHLERLNVALVTVSQQFIAQISPRQTLPDRIALCDILNIDW